MSKKQKTSTPPQTPDELMKEVCPRLERKINELKEEAVKELRETLQTELSPLRDDVKYLMEKDHDDEVIQEYLRRHPNKKQRSELTNQQWLNKELIKVIIYILGILAAAIGGQKLWH